MSITWKRPGVSRTLARFLFGFSTCSMLMYGTNFIATDSLQTWTVPQTGTYQIIAVGGSGGIAPFTFLPNSNGGRGANVTGDYSLSGGDVLNIIVGQAGGSASSSFDKYGAGGGGGASVVQDASGVTYVVAGGGGGAGAQSGFNGSNAGEASSAGMDGVSNKGGGAAGVNEGGGGGGQSVQDSGAEGGGGSGLISSGTSGIGADAGAGGVMFSGNAQSGTHGGAGGFGGGGGGGGEGDGGGGGGGGYNGGGGGADSAGGGGGGSFSLDPQAIFSTASYPGDGYIYINQEVGSVTPVPEPADFGLLTLAIALALLAWLVRPRVSSAPAE